MSLLVTVIAKGYLPDEDGVLETGGAIEAASYPLRRGVLGSIAAAAARTSCCCCCDIDARLVRSTPAFIEKSDL